MDSQTNPEIGRVNYPRIDERGQKLNAEAVFYKDGQHRFQQTDGWELVPWDIEPGDQEVRFARRLLASGNLPHDNTSKLNEIEFDNQLAYEALVVPDSFDRQFTRLSGLVKSVAAGGNGRAVFATIDEIKEVHATGEDLLDIFLQLKRKVRGWLLSVDELEEKLFTFDTRVNGRVPMTTDSNEVSNGSAATEIS